MKSYLFLVDSEYLTVQIVVSKLLVLNSMFIKFISLIFIEKKWIDGANAEGLFSPQFKEFTSHTDLSHQMLQFSETSI